MILTPMIALIPFLAQVDKPATAVKDKPTTAAVQEAMLNRTFKVGEKLEYLVKAGLHQEFRGAGLTTWIPDEDDISYKFTTEVLSLKPDGGAAMRYLRPKMTHVAGETVDSGPKTTIENLDLDFLLTLSPINEVLSIKDQTKKKPKPEGGSNDGESSSVGGADARHAGRSSNPTGRPQLGGLIDMLTGGVAELVMFLGSPDSGLDFAPKLPWVAVTPGYTWKKTNGFSPQKVKESGKMAVQRLDYTYTYTGPVDVGGKRFLRIHAELTLDTDLGQFLMQEFGLKAEDTVLKGIPFKLQSQLDFDLDPVTKRTVKAVATSSGEARILIKGSDEAEQELKLKGKTTMSLLSAKP